LTGGGLISVGVSDNRDRTLNNHSTFLPFYVTLHLEINRNGSQRGPHNGRAQTMNVEQNSAGQVNQKSGDVQEFDETEK
jgi:hypothetical protein